MSAQFEKGNIPDIKNGAMSKALKLAAVKLACTEIKEIDIKDINTYYLRDRGANELHLAG